MEENRARRVVDALRERGIDAHMLRAGVDKFGVQVSLHDGRNAEWDTDGTIGLEAQVMQDGDLVGFVPKIEGSENFDEAQIVDAIARTDYDRPIATERAAAPAPAEALPRARWLPAGRSRSVRSRRRSEPRRRPQTPRSWARTRPDPRPA